LDFLQSAHSAANDRIIIGQLIRKDSIEYYADIWMEEVRFECGISGELSGCAGLSTVTFLEGAQGRSLEPLTYFRKNKNLVAKKQANAAATSVLGLVWLQGRIHRMEKWVSDSQTLDPYRHFAQSVLDSVCFIPIFS